MPRRRSAIFVNSVVKQWGAAGSLLQATFGRLPPHFVHFVMPHSGRHCHSKTSAARHHKTQRRLTPTEHMPAQPTPATAQHDMPTIHRDTHQPHPATAWRLPVARPHATLFAFVLIANLFVYAVLGVVAHLSYLQVKEKAAAKSRSLNALLAENVTAELERIKLGLVACAAEVFRQRREGAGPEATAPDFLHLVRRQLPMAANLIVIDRAGTVIFSTDFPPTKRSASERAYFQRFAADPSLTFQISEPLLGWMVEKPVLHLVARIPTRDGAFDGLVVAAVTVDWFIAKFQAMDIGEQGAVVLRGDASRNFDLLARFRPTGKIGETIVSDTFRATIAAHPAQGTYEANAGNDGIHRTFSYQKLEGLPLITLVGLASEDYLVEWQHRALSLLAVALGFSLMTGAASAFVVRAWRRQAESAEQIRLLLNYTASGIIGLDRQGHCTFCNPAAVRMLGARSEQDLVGQDIHAIIHGRAEAHPCRPAACPMLTEVAPADLGIHRDVFWQLDGRGFPVEYWAHPQRRKGEFIGTVVTFIDLRDRVLANTDALTELANRHRFDETLAAEWSRRLRAEDDFALLLIDVDHFKAYNDTHGHVAGDDCLRQVARAIQRALERETDLAARYGGEEFACILPGTNEAGAWRVAERIRAELASLALPHAGSPVGPCVTVSIGIVAVPPGCPAEVKDVLRAADAQLYKAKSAGRDRICAQTLDAAAATAAEQAPAPNWV